MYAKQLKVPDVSLKKFQPSPRPSPSQEARKIHLELLLDQGDMLRIFIDLDDGKILTGKPYIWW